MYQPPSTLVDTWIRENNELVNKRKQHNRGGSSLDREKDQSRIVLLTSEFQKLSRKIQGLPPHSAHMQLELSVVFNAGFHSIASSQVSEANLLVSRTLDRFLQMTGNEPSTPNTSAPWTMVLSSARNTEYNPSVLHLLSLQWAIWLATGSLEDIHNLQEELFSLCEKLSAGAGDNVKRGQSSNVPLLVEEPRELITLLHVCTHIFRGAERLNEGRCLEALTDLQMASNLPAPRALVAYTHHLSGSCLAQMSRPQMALQCFKKALEIDSRCICALYQSMLIYKHLGNTQAEIQALHLLHSILTLHSAAKPAVADTVLLPFSVLLQSQSLNSLLSVPSPLAVLHNLALKCVLHGRVLEGVDYYLDLLAALHSEHHHGLHAEVSQLPRLPKLYLESGFALLKARRPVDCLTLCDEVITTTAELLPKKMLLEEPVEISERAEGGEGVLMLLWTGAAYLIQGHCHTQMRDWKQAVIDYTRCINLLLKVHVKRRGCQPEILSAGVADEGTDLFILQRLKGLSLAYRGVSFTQTEQLTEALRDLQLSLLAFPDCQCAGLWYGEVLWRLGRRQEAATSWKKTWSFTVKSSLESVPVYLGEPQCGPVLDSRELHSRVQELGPS